MVKIHIATSNSIGVALDAKILNNIHNLNIIPKNDFTKKILQDILDQLANLQVSCSETNSFPESPPDELDLILSGVCASTTSDSENQTSSPMISTPLGIDDFVQISVAPNTPISNSLQEFYPQEDISFLEDLLLNE